MRQTMLGLAIGALASTAAVAGNDFGLKTQNLLKAQSYNEFGIVKPLDAGLTTNVARVPNQPVGQLVNLATGLKAEYVTRAAGGVADMFAFWPNAVAPTHLVFCIEGGRQNLGTVLPGAGGLAKFNPSVQRVEIATGAVETILRGMTACDGIRTTPWQTILATEETTTGQAYEILDPLASTNLTITDRAAAAGLPGAIVDADGQDASAQAVKRDALAKLAWEGLDITPTGVVYFGDELRPGTGTADKDGGALFKFLPAVPHAGGPIATLAQSPLVAGTNYAYRASCTTGVQFGQGCEIGLGNWVAVTAANARNDADLAGATGYYRPEDLHFDPTYTGAGIRLCVANTGNEDAQNWAEVVCMTDDAPASAASRPVAQRFVEGDSDFNSFDNLHFQPKTGITYVIEDDENGDIFACLPDGADRDIKTDGCVRILTVRDQSAEPTGFEFDASGTTAYVSIQHSTDSACTAGTDCANVDDYPTDDILKITGFKLLPGMIK